MCVYRVYYSSRVVPNVLSIALMFSFYEWVDLLPPLYLYKSSGKVVLERSEFVKSCLRQAHCLTKIFLSPLQASLFLRFCTGLSFKPATSLIRSGAGAEQGIR